MGSAAADWSVLEPRLCGEPHKEAQTEARCRNSGAVKDIVEEEEWTRPPWVGGVARRQGPCAGCALAELLGPR